MREVAHAASNPKAMPATIATFVAQQAVRPKTACCSSNPRKAMEARSGGRQTLIKGNGQFV